MESKAINNIKTNMSKVRNLTAVLCCAMMFCAFALSPSVFTFCTQIATASNAIMSMISDMSSQLYVTMRGIIIPIVICFVGYAGICFLTGGARGAEKAVGILKYCFIAVVFVAFAPLLGQQLGNWVAGYGTGDLSGYNPL